MSNSTLTPARARCRRCRQAAQACSSARNWQRVRYRRCSTPRSFPARVLQSLNIAISRRLELLEEHPERGAMIPAPMRTMSANGHTLIGWKGTEARARGSRRCQGTPAKPRTGRAGCCRGARGISANAPRMSRFPASRDASCGTAGAGSGHPHAVAMLRPAYGLDLCCSRRGLLEQP